MDHRKTPPQIGYRKPNGVYVDIAPELLRIMQAFEFSMLRPHLTDARAAEELDRSFHSLGRMLDGTYP